MNKTFTILIGSFFIILLLVGAGCLNTNSDSPVPTIQNQPQATTNTPSNFEEPVETPTTSETTGINVDPPLSVTSSADVNVKNSPEPEKTTPLEQPVKSFSLTAKQWAFDPSTITVNKGDRVRLTITSIDVEHGFGLPAFDINVNLEPNKTEVIEFVADKSGAFTFFCSVFCGTGHQIMNGQLIVQ